MRIYDELPERDAKRVITRFLFIPRKIGNEIRWLEVTKIEQTWTCYKQHKYMKVPIWYDIRFLPYDPVKDCKIYKESGCVHVDGMLCDINSCNTEKDG